jgi:hypothetical protein
MSTDPRARYDEVVAELVATSPVTSGKMFGMPCLKHHASGKAFAGFSAGAMVFKLTGVPHREALQLAGAHLFDPMGGRPMKEWVEVPVEHASRWVQLAQEALRYVDEAQQST